MGLKDKKNKSSFLTIIVFLSISIILLGLYNSLNAVNNIFWESKYKTWSWIERINKETWEKTFEKEINVLIVWRWWEENDAPQLTDSIILAKVNPKTRNISMLSIQRDLYVNYPDKDWHWKINSVYSHYYFKSKKDEKFAMWKLAEKIKEITWENVDYYVNIDFSWFRNIIDSIWWVEIDVEEGFTDRTYPTKNWWYQTVSFKKWLQKMDWDTALKYSRSRHSTSDFDRSLRQQKVLKAIKDKLTSKEWLSEANLTELFSGLMKNFSTDVSLNDAISLVKDLKFLKENYDFYSSNFNDTCYSDNSICEKWWILYVPKRDLFWGSWVSLVNGSTSTSLSKYDVSEKYANIVLNFPKIEKENFEINILNGTKTPWAWAFVNWLKKYWFNTSFKNVWNAPESFDETIIYFNGISENSDTIKWLEKLFKWKFEKTAQAKFSDNWEDLEEAQNTPKIEIVIWKDYFQDKKIFNF